MHQSPGTTDEQKPSEWKLFDLEKDPYELNSVYHDPAYAEIATELPGELRRLQEELKDEPYPEEQP